MDDVSIEQASEQASESAGEVAELYLGNILYALEVTAVSLEQEGKGQDAAFYRGVARKLAQAHGAAKRRSAGASGGPGERVVL